MKVKAVALLIVGVMAGTGCQQIPRARADDTYDNERIGNNAIRHEIYEDDIEFFIADWDLGFIWPETLEGHEFALYVDDELMAKQDLNRFLLRKATFMDEPKDIEMQIIDDRKESILSVSLNDFMVYRESAKPMTVVNQYADAKSLHVQGSVSDLSGIGELSNLSYLSLSKLSEDDFDELEGLINLKKLAILECEGLTDLSFLENYADLKYLVLAGCCNVEDLSPLANLKNLEYVLLISCYSLEDISSLAELPNLKYVNLIDSQNIRDRSPIEGRDGVVVDAY